MRLIANGNVEIPLRFLVKSWRDNGHHKEFG